MRNRPCRLTPWALVNLKDVTAKNASRVKLVGIGLGASTKRLALGCAARNAPSVSGLPAPAAAAARRNSRNSSPVRTGKPFVEWATMSVWTWSARWKRTAIPRGLDRFGSLSGIVGTPVESE